MANLTKEYFDQQLKKLATKDDLVKLEGRLKAHTEHEVADLAGMVARRFDGLERKLDVRADVEQLKTQMKKVWDALHL